jgi:hypothetical protein
MLGDRLILGAAGVVVVILFLVIVTQLSPNARLRRRLKKTHSRIVTKSERPTVKFSVKPPKE